MNTSASIFVDDEEMNDAQYFDKVIPLDSNGATSLTYLVRREGREFFMKRLKPEHRGNNTYVNLFRKEYELGKRLNSPHIVTYEELGEDEDGIYILCEYICGATLDQKLTAAPEWFTVKKNLDRMFCQLLDALEHMHELHVVHADLKPQNLMLTRINNDVKVIDLGFAFADGYTYSMGCTPNYAAPEQQMGYKDMVDISTDVYGIGKLLEFIHQETDRGLPKIYQRIMTRCLQKEQSKRYQNMSDIRREILHRKHVLRNTSIITSILLALTLAGYIFFNTTTGLKICESIRWTMRLPAYDTEVKGIFYRHLAADSSTCAVVGGRCSANGAGQLEGDNIKVLECITWDNGKTSHVVAIADSAYYGGKNFTSLLLPIGLESIGVNAFKECEGITVVNVPQTVTHIGNEAFAGMTSLEKIHLPDSLETIPSGMAHHSTKLKRIHIPEKIRVLPLDIFAGCIGLQEVVIPPHLERIERGVFWECKSLQTITLPATMKYIGEFSFFHCDRLKHVYLHASQPPQMCNAFQKQPQLVIHVPKDAEKLYKEHIDWKDMNIVGDLDER